MQNSAGNVNRETLKEMTFVWSEINLGNQLLWKFSKDSKTVWMAGTHFKLSDLIKGIKFFHLDGLKEAFDL